MKNSHSITTIRCGRMIWKVRADAAEMLLPALEKGRAALLHGAQIVKDKPYRRIFLVKPPPSGEPLIVKQYRNRTALETLKRSIFPTTATREWRRANAMLARGVPVPKPLAVGHARKRLALTDSWLILEAIPNARSLRQALDAAKERDHLCVLIEGAARLVRKMHDVGFQHLDLHANNILLGGPDDSTHMFISDMQGVRGRRMTFRRRCLDLARLDASILSTRLRRTQRLRFLKAYLAAEHDARLRAIAGVPKGDDGLISVMRAWAENVLRLERKILARYYRGRTKRCLVNSTLFAVERTPQRMLYRLREYTASEILAIIERHRKCLASLALPAALPQEVQNCKVLKRTAHTNVTLVPDARGEKLVCVKEYRPRGLLHRSKDIFRRPPAMREWISARALSVRRTAAPEAIALLCPSLAAFSRGYYFIMRQLPDAMPIHVRAMRREAEGRKAKLTFIEQAADFVASLYRRDVVHGDMKVSNVLATDSADKPQFFLVDLAAMRFRSPRRSDVIRNLAQLHASMPLAITFADRLRFLRRYLQKSGSREASDWRRVARDVVKESSKKTLAWQRM